MLITELFDERPWIKGMINLRGEVLPIVDIRERFDIKEKSITDDTVIIVVKTEENKLIGVIVDNISSILELGNQQVIPAPDMGVSIDPKYIDGLVKINSEDMAILLNMDMILKIEELV